ncbi:MAG TPA: zinc ribbon domain-containing protein [Levilinea sp.]|nr:zinc ribbon domain-containing protein [Levilinea sp.]
MEIPRHWRLKQQRYALVGEVCNHCDAKIFPPREVCPHCGLEAKFQFLNREPVQMVAIPVLDGAQRQA